MEPNKQFLVIYGHVSIDITRLLQYVWYLNNVFEMSYAGLLHSKTSIQNIRELKLLWTSDGRNTSQ